MSKIIMTQTQTGSNDGLKVSIFKKGEEYVVEADISIALARAFVDDMEVAHFVKSAPVEIPSETIIEPIEETKMESVPENKSEDNSPDNKKEDEKKEEKEEEDKSSNCFGTFDKKDKGCKSCDDKKDCEKKTKKGK